MNLPAAEPSAPRPPDGESVRVSERLTTTLFLATLLHGIVILGVTFADPIQRTAMPSIEVLLLADERPNESDNPDAKYLAQRNQKGSGNATDGHPSSPPSTLIAGDLAGSVNGNSTTYRSAAAGSEDAELIAARGVENEVTRSTGTPSPAQAEETPLAFNVGVLSPLSSGEDDGAVRLQGPKARELEVQPDTRESRIAPYLSAWRSKVEHLGSINYPRLANRQLEKSPVLEVALGADGRLLKVIVRRSSGEKELDQAAVDILKLAAPFEPFPESLQRDYDVLRFSYEWQFVRGRMSGSVRAGTG
jgi:protein TonB